MSKRCIIVEGGGFKTGFTSGILDAFIVSDYNPFDICIGTSGGAVALSYFLSRQYQSCINAIKFLSTHQDFTDFKRSLQNKGYMDIDYIANVAETEVPFDVKKALKLSKNKDVRLIATNRKSGKPAYLKPNKENWLDAVIASSTLPFVTKGRHVIDKVEYFDGGWSDPLPVKWAYEQGAREILVLRTWPKNLRSRQSWTDYFGSLYFRSTPSLGKTFASSFEKYNKSLDYMENPPSDLKLTQISPIKLLKSSTYSYTSKTIMKDYRYGLDLGTRHVFENKK